MKAFKTFWLINLFLLLINTTYAQTKSGNNINNIYNSYIEIKNSLVKNDPIKAEINANKLYAILAARPDKGLNWKQRRVLADYFESLLDDTREICYTISTDEQRHYFADLSKNLYYLLKELQMNTSIIYMQYSPKNKAYWLSETPVIKNPYYTYKGMTNMGKTTAILAAHK